DGELLADVGAVEDHLIVAGLSLDDVAAFARVPDEGVVAVAHVGRILTPAAVDEVIAVAAVQRVVAVAAVQRVVPRATVHRDLDERGEAVAGGDHVVAAVGVDARVLRRPDVEEEWGGIDAVEPDPGPVGGDGEVLASVAADNLDGVVAGAPFV